MAKILQWSLLSAYVITGCMASRILLQDEEICPAPLCIWVNKWRYPPSHSVGAFHNISAIPHNMRVFCRRGLNDFYSAPFLSSLWTALKLNIVSKTTDFEVYQGHNIYEVKSAKSGWLTWAQPERQLRLSPYKTQCWGVVFQSPDRYYMQISANPFHLPTIGCLVVGLLLFFLAPSLSRSASFFYTSGTIIGTLTFLVLLVLIISRLFPQRGLVLAILVSGWTGAAYVLRSTWDSASDLIQAYPTYVFGYVAISAFLSLAYCYNKGPPTSTCSHFLIQLSLQFIAAVLIYNGTQSCEVSSAIIAVAIPTYLLPQSVIKWLGRLLVLQSLILLLGWGICQVVLK